MYCCVSFSRSRKSASGIKKGGKRGKREGSRVGRKKRRCSFISCALFLRSFLLFFASTSAAANSTKQKAYRSVVSFAFSFFETARIPSRASKKEREKGSSATEQRRPLALRRRQNSTQKGKKKNVGLRSSLLARSPVSPSPSLPLLPPSSPDLKKKNQRSIRTHHPIRLRSRSTHSCEWPASIDTIRNRGSLWSANHFGVSAIVFPWKMSVLARFPAPR